MTIYRLLIEFHPKRGRPQAIRNSRSVAAASFLAVLALWLPQARATTLARMSVRELTQQSTYVARVRCVSVVSVADFGLVWTLTTFEVAQPWKGNPPPRFTVRLPGGEAAGVRVSVEGAPRFTVGEDLVLFLTADRGRLMNIVSWAQGTFRIRKNPRTRLEEAVQDTAGLEILDAHSGRAAQGGRRELPLAVLRASVLAAARETLR
ncbi:MAG TPA: hypothetical protein VEG63_08205 [Candidatus Acidoferrales bacterium]|nr:hypothetical protein [Candidatus Acidoferrales bacterium]